MKLRQTLVAVPASLLVAELAHAAGFGSDHLLGGEAGPEFFGAGLAWAALLTILGVLDVALRAPLHRSPGRTAAGLAEALPGGGNLAALGATLGAGGYTFYAALEALEGHGLGTTFGALWLVVPLAVAVAASLRVILTWVAGAGLRLASLCSASRTAARPALRVPAPVPLPHRSAAGRGRRSGRAPPSRA